MHRGWGLWISGFVLGAAAGFVSGHVAAWTRADSATHRISAGFHADAPQLAPIVEPAPHDGPVYFPDRLTQSESPVPEPAMLHADAELPSAAPRAIPVAEPAELSAPADATLIPDKEQQTLRAVLDTELADMPVSDREVWLEALDGMPPADALGVVRMWKRFGSGPGLMSKSEGTDFLPSTTAPSALLPTPNAPAQFSSGPFAIQSPTTNLLGAQQLVGNNLVGAGVFGFRRVEPQFALAPAIGVGNLDPIPLEPRPELQFIGSRIDHTPGNLVETASPLDLAIDGQGFFVVTDPEQGPLFTRCGRFSRDADGRLVLKTSRGELPVQPEITIPDDCAAVTVSSDGEVSIIRDEGTPESVGTLSLALFVAPAQLASTHDALFSPTPESGNPQIGRPTQGLRGQIFQYSLERSNVDVVTEQALLRHIDEWLELMSDVP